MNCLTSTPAASSKETQSVTQASPGKPRQVTNATVCQLFNMCKLCKQGFPVPAGAQLFCVSQKQNLLSTSPGEVGLLLKLLQELALGTGSGRKNAGSTPESSAVLSSIRFKYAQMSVRREGQSFGNYISNLSEVIFAVSSLPTLQIQQLSTAI